MLSFIALEISQLLVLNILLPFLLPLLLGLLCNIKPFEYDPHFSYATYFSPCAAAWILSIELSVTLVLTSDMHILIRHILILEYPFNHLVKF